MSTETEKPVKVSICSKCNGWVRLMTLEYYKTNTIARNEFLKEVGNYNLIVKEMPLEEYKANEPEMCVCKT